MNSLVRDKGYKELLSEIGTLYNNARSVLVQTYWQIGKLIVEQEQLGSDKANYGSQLLEHLSEDLTVQFGDGFSSTNIYRIRRFYLTHRIFPPAGKLSWTQYVELLPVC